MSEPGSPTITPTLAAPLNPPRLGLPVRSTFSEFALLVGGAVLTGCGVALAAMAVVLLLAR